MWTNPRRKIRHSRVPLCLAGLVPRIGSMKKSSVLIPPKFWGSVSDAEFVAIAQRGFLDREQAARLWRMCDYQGDPPERVEVRIAKEK